MSLALGRISAVPLYRLAGIAVDAADHPIATAGLFHTLGLSVVVLGAVAAEVRLDTGSVIQLRQSRTPTLLCLRFGVRDLTAAAQAFEGWTVHAPNVIRVQQGDLTADVTETARPGLVAITANVSDEVTAARFYSPLGLPVTPIDAADDSYPDQAEPAADVTIGDVTLQLRAAGLGPVTLAHIW
ncbi:MAG: hypothetical protein R2763_01280 [Mycobacterium sp.]